MFSVYTVYTREELANNMPLAKKQQRVNIAMWNMKPMPHAGICERKKNNEKKEKPNQEKLVRPFKNSTILW